MEKPTLELIAEINALQRMRTDELRAKYADLIPDMAECRKCEVLRTEIAYRLQERYYGISLPPQTQARLREIAAKHSPHSDRPLAGTRLIRNWKGVRHEVIIRDDGMVEYGNALYKSLSAVARKITGTNWNGHTFFGLKK